MILRGLNRCRNGDGQIEDVWHPLVSIYMKVKRNLRTIPRGLNQGRNGVSQIEDVWHHLYLSI